MKALILAAGYGTRLRPLTHHLPKPLMPIVGQPLLGHIITKLQGCKVSGLGINLHHRFESIQQFLDREQPGIAIHLSHEKEILGSGGGIGGFRRFLAGEEWFMVHNGDILSTLPLVTLIAEYEKRKPLCALVLHDHSGCNNVAVDSENTIIDMRNVLRPRQECRMLAYTGVAFIRSDMLQFIPEGPSSDLIEVLLEVIRAGEHSVEGLICEGRAWCDIGTPAQYLHAHHEILCNRTGFIDKACIPDGPFFAGEETSVAEDVQLNGFVSAGKGCEIKSGAVLRNCILWDGAVIEEGQVLENAVVGPGWIVPGKQGDTG